MLEKHCIVRTGTFVSLRRLRFANASLPFTSSAQAIELSMLSYNPFVVGYIPFSEAMTSTSGGQTLASLYLIVAAVVDIVIAIFMSFLLARELSPSGFTR